MATSNSATLRLFSLAEQCHTQNFYLRCFKNEDDLKNEENLQSEDDLKNEDSIKNEDDLKS